MICKERDRERERKRENDKERERERVRENERERERTRENERERERKKERAVERVRERRGGGLQRKHGIRLRVFELGQHTTRDIAFFAHRAHGRQKCICGNKTKTP